MSLLRLAVVIAALLVAACGGGGAASQSVAPGVGTTATFILANPGGLSALDDAGRLLGKVVKLPDQSAPSTPALHPSGTLIAFSLTGQADAKRGFGSDIYTVNLDGTGLKPILLHEDNNVFYASPRFDASGNVLYVHRRAAVITNGTYSGNDDAIVRVDLRTNVSTRLIKDGADPTLSSDGKTIVYVHLKDSQVDALWRADIDGSNAAPLIKGKDALLVPAGAALLTDRVSDGLLGRRAHRRRGAKRRGVRAVPLHRRRGPASRASEHPVGAVPCAVRWIVAHVGGSDGR